MAAALQYDPILTGLRFLQIDDYAEVTHFLAEWSGIVAQ